MLSKPEDKTRASLFSELFDCKEEIVLPIRAYFFSIQSDGVIEYN